MKKFLVFTKKQWVTEWQGVMCECEGNVPGMAYLKSN